jgi:hypothetical protein
VLATGVVTLVLCELGLQLAARVSPAVAGVLSTGVSLIVPDAELGQRPNPEVPEHDAVGWRNAERWTRADVVAIGDSQTYGSIVSREEAWPQRLGELSGLRVYNMGLGGYGPPEYWLLLSEALTLEPERVLVGLYAGNDFWNAYAVVYREGRVPALRAQDPRLLETLERAESGAADPLEAWHRTRSARRPAWRRLLDSVLDPIRTHSGLWGLARAVARAAGRRGPGVETLDLERARAVGDPALLWPVRIGEIATVLTPSQRLVVLDRSDPRIAEGVRLTREAIGHMSRECTGRCRLAVVFLPTKELVFEAALRESGVTPTPELARLVEWELGVWDELRRDLAERGISWVETLPALRASLAAGESPFPSDWNGHLDARGNAVVARAILEAGAVRAPAPVAGSGTR